MEANEGSCEDENEENTHVWKNMKGHVRVRRKKQDKSQEMKDQP